MTGKRTVLVTGASRGIGRAIARELAGMGMRVAVGYRTDEAAARETVAMIEETDGEAYPLRIDVADREGCRAVLEEEMTNQGVYWGVVLNAGVIADGPLPGLRGEDWDRVIHTNLDGFYNVLHPLVMPMIRAKRGGRIVTMSSLSGIAGNRGQTNYAASKAGVIAATRSLARELGKRGITVNSVAPGLIETEMTEDLPSNEIVKTIPLRRLGRADEVAAVVGFLFSERAGYITGEVISINGGLL